MEELDVEAEAERVQRTALRKMWLLGGAFLVWQILYFLVFPDSDDHVRRVDLVRAAGFLAWSVALLLLFATGGRMLRSKKLRPYLDDERAQALRAIAYRNGFWAMIVICVTSYVATLVTQLRAVDLAHICVSAGVLSVLASTVVLERRGA